MPNLPPPIAAGRTAEIFPWAEGQALKLIRPGFFPGLADQEYDRSLAAWQLGAPVPRPFELLEVDGRRGVVIERVDGPTLTRCIQQHPLRVADYGRMLGRLHAGLHALSVPGFPPLTERARNNIENTPLLEPALKERLLAALDTLPGGERICHGDFHPDNVLIAEKGPVVIDWEGSMRADPSADVAITRMFLHLAMLLTPGVRGWLVRRALSVFERAYLREYVRAGGPPPRDQPLWTAVVIAMRLGDEMGPLLPKVLPLIEAGLRGQGWGKIDDKPQRLRNSRENH